MESPTPPCVGRVQEFSDPPEDHPTNTLTPTGEVQNYNSAAARGACSANRLSPSTRGSWNQNSAVASTNRLIQINNRNGNIQLNCLQINLQHKIIATANLMHIIDTCNIDIALIQEPYILHNKLVGITKNTKFSHKEITKSEQLYF